MKIDLDKMNLKELQDLKNKVEIAIASFESKKIEEAQHKVKQVLDEMGLTLDDLKETKVKRTKKASPPKYAHSENPELTWSGRGRKPNWVIAHLDQGLPLDDLLIKT